MDGFVHGQLAVAVGQVKGRRSGPGLANHACEHAGEAGDGRIDGGGVGVATQAEPHGRAGEATGKVEGVNRRRRLARATRAGGARRQADALQIGCHHDCLPVEPRKCDRRHVRHAARGPADDHRRAACRCGRRRDERLESVAQLLQPRGEGRPLGRGEFQGPREPDGQGHRLRPAAEARLLRPRNDRVERHGAPREQAADAPRTAELRRRDHERRLDAGRGQGQRRRRPAGHGLRGIDVHDPPRCRDRPLPDAGHALDGSRLTARGGDAQQFRGRPRRGRGWSSEPAVRTEGEPFDAPAGRGEGRRRRHHAPVVAG